MGSQFWPGSPVLGFLGCSVCGNMGRGYGRRARLRKVEREVLMRKRGWHIQD